MTGPDPRDRDPLDPIPDPPEVGEGALEKPQPAAPAFRPTDPVVPELVDNDRVAEQVRAVEVARAKLVTDIDVLDREVRLEVLYRMETFAWKAVAGIAAAVAGLSATKVLTAIWDKVIPDTDPPDDPTDPDTSARDALVWTVLTGLGVGLSTVFAQRSAAKGWTRATGKKPPAFEKAKRKKGR